MPVISVVIPAYNAEGTIKETLQSVQKQTFSDFEIIVINDGSTDQTLEVINTVQDSRISVFSYSNGGLPVARNRGILQANGEFITFLDADDLWTPDKLELQLAALQQHPEAGLAYSWTLIMDEKGENFYPGKSFSFEGNVYSELLISNFIASGSNAMLRREAIESVGEFDAELRSCEDWDYWLRVAPHWHFVVVPKPQILYRQSSGAMSSKVDVMEKYHLLVLERAFAAAPPELQPLKNQSLAIEYQFLAQLCLMHNSSTEGAKQACHKLQQAVRLYPNLLLNKNIYSLIIKLLIIKLLSPEIANFIFQGISKSRASKNESLA
jgi:glycosyltransferase involved in cell wall biosynthesis